MNPSAGTAGARQSVSLAIAGSGGSGVMTAGELLLRAAARAGWYGLMTRSYGPQIRGGEAMATIRLATRPVECVADRNDLLLAIDWQNIERFLPELRLNADSLLLNDPKSGEIPESIQDLGARPEPLPLTELAGPIDRGRANMVALGALAAMIGLPRDALDATVETAMRKRGRAAVVAGLDSVAAGRSAAAKLPELPLAPPDGAPGERWSITGNEAAACGALRGGIRFAAGYPITPATEILEWLAAKLPKVGGVLVQAEDELASAAQIIGASFGGVPSVTATSGPGLSLMAESIGLAVAAEVPIVIINVMRGGPSTGIPTRSEQTDLNIAVYGLHGDAPHVVLAPLSVADCLFTTQWATQLAEAIQTPAIVLSDQYLAQARTIIDRPADVSLHARRDTVEQVDGGYQRYRLTASGVSPMAIPGLPGGQYTADGLEHSESGVPSSTSANHAAQLDKRLRKLEGYDYGDYWAEIDGAGDTAVITWGSAAGPVREALDAERDWRERYRLIAIRLLAPARPQQLAKALDGTSRIVVIEQSQTGQFAEYLRARYGLPDSVRACPQPGAMAICPDAIRRDLAGVSA